jgi:hypothetical protein
MLVVDYFAYVTCPGASAHHAAHRATFRAAHRRLLRLAQARRRLLRLCRVSGYLGTSRGSSSTTSPHAGSSSTTSPTPRVRVPRHVARFVAQLVAWLIVDYFASRRLVVDYFAYAARPGASGRRAARCVAHRQLLRLAQLVVDCFTYAARPGASARRAAHRAARRAAHRRLLHLAQACRRLLRLRRASECLGTLHGSSRGSSRDSSRSSSSTTSPTPCIRVPQHVVWLISPLAVDYFTPAARPGASARRVSCHAARRQLLRALRLPLVATLALLQPRRASRLLVLRQYWLYFEYTAHRHDVVFRSHHVDH